MKKFSDYSEAELIELLYKQHLEEKLSLREIARNLGTYATKLLRFCNKHQIPVLSKSEALSAAYSSKRITNPNKGVIRTEEERAKLSEAQAKAWNSLSEEERESRRKSQREAFAKRPDKEEFYMKGCRAIRKAADEGSKLEKELMKFFKKDGIDFVHHYKGIFGGTRLEADFYLPAHNLVIEVDGPSHFTNNFGTANFSSQLAADNKKNGIVLNLGLSIMRLQHSKTLYRRDYRIVVEFLKNNLMLNNEVRIVNVDELVKV